MPTKVIESCKSFTRLGEYALKNPKRFKRPITPERHTQPSSFETCQKAYKEGVLDSTQKNYPKPRFVDPLNSDSIPRFIDKYEDESVTICKKYVRSIEDLDYLD